MAEPYPARTFIQNQIGIGLATQRNFQETSHVPVRPDRSLFLHLPPEQFRLQHTIGRISAVERKVRARSEEHTSELQSLAYLVCRLLLEKKKIQNNVT